MAALGRRKSGCRFQISVISAHSNRTFRHKMSAQTKVKNYLTQQAGRRFLMSSFAALIEDLTNENDTSMSGVYFRFD